MLGYAGSGTAPLRLQRDACLPGSPVVWPTLVEKLEKHETRECLLSLVITPHKLRSCQQGGGQSGGATEFVMNSSGHHCLGPIHLRPIHLPLHSSARESQVCHSLKDSNWLFWVLSHICGNLLGIGDTRACSQ